MRIKTENWAKTNCKSLLLISCSGMTIKQAEVKDVDLVDLAAAEKVDLAVLVVDAVVLELGAVVLEVAEQNDLVVLTHNLRVLFEMRPSSSRVHRGG